MRRMISSGLFRYAFMARGDLQPGETPMAFTTVTARQLVDSLLQNPAANSVLRSVLSGASAFTILGKLGNREVGAQLVRRLVSGQIVVVQTGMGQTGKRKGQKPEKAPEPDAVPAPKFRDTTADDDVHWIRFELLDAADTPLPGVKLELALPDKDPKVYDAGKNGIVFCQKQKAGKCDLNMILSAGVYEVDA